MHVRYCRFRHTIPYRTYENREVDVDSQGLLFLSSFRYPRRSIENIRFSRSGTDIPPHSEIDDPDLLVDLSPHIIDMTTHRQFNPAFHFNDFFFSARFCARSLLLTLARSASDWSCPFLHRMCIERTVIKVHPHGYKYSYVSRQGRARTSRGHGASPERRGYSCACGGHSPPGVHTRG